MISLNLSGVTIASPFKEKVKFYLSKYDRVVHEIGVCNIILRYNKKISLGFNTDYYAILETFKEKDIRNVVICGTGGYAKTAELVCKDEGISYSIIGRSNWTDIPLESEENIFNATPVILNYPNVINASPETDTGRKLFVKQARYNFEIFSDGIKYPLQS